MRNRSLDLLMFLTGLFAMTEVYVGGFSAISELVIFMVAPFVFINDLPCLKRDGFMPLVWLLFLTICGCVLASILNHTAFPSLARGLAALYGLFIAVRFGLNQTSCVLYVHCYKVPISRQVRPRRTPMRQSTFA